MPDSFNQPYKGPAAEFEKSPEIMQRLEGAYSGPATARLLRNEYLYLIFGVFI